MAIVLNHTIVPARDRVASAQWFARIFGVPYRGTMGPFAAVQVNDTLTLDFDERRPDFDSRHYAFHVSEDEFDAIFGRVQEASIPYGSGPYALEDSQINHRQGGRGVYFRDPDGHILELMTRALVA